jgi:hypothetical protein
MELGPVSPQQAMDRSRPRVRSSRPRVFAGPALTPAVRRRMLLNAGLLIALVGIAIALPSLRGGSAVRAAGARAGASLPTAAWARISQTLGAQRLAFHVGGARGNLQAANPAQGLSASFTRSGVELRGATARLHIGLQAIGRGGSYRELGEVTPSASANRVTYEHAGLDEWYVNGPLGFEQGFTIPRAPSASAGAPLTLAIAFSGNARSELARGGRGVTLGEGASSIRYGDLTATDARGRPLHSWLKLSAGRLLLQVDDAHARYPLTIDPLIQTGGRLAVSAGEQSPPSLLGASVALSSDGDTALVGAPHDNNGAGAAWVFVKEGETWKQQGAKLTAGEPGGTGQEDCDEEAEEPGECAFGASVALSSNGNTALVGAPSGTESSGAAWVFTRTGSSWSAPYELGSGGGRFGRSVALSADGTTALVGDPSANLEHGAASVFTLSGSTWSTQAVLTDLEASRGAHFGRGVALSGDGSTALIGGPGDNGYAGAAWSFTRSGSTWAETGKLTGQDGRAHFGKSVALSGDGDTALVGGPTDAENRGAAWVFARSGSSFVQPGTKLTGLLEGGEGHFGASVALSSDGSDALVGAPREGGPRGVVTEFERPGELWTAEDGLESSEASVKAGSGMSVALSGSGETVLFGAPLDEARVGSAWIFTFVPASAVPPPVVSNVTPKHGPTSGGTKVTIEGGEFTRNAQHEPTVMFGSEPATNVHVLTNLKIEAVSPPAPEGVVPVMVCTAKCGTSKATFRYEAPSSGGGGGASGGEEPSKTTTSKKEPSKGSSSSSSTSSGSSSPTPTPSVGVLGVSGAGSAACRVSLSSKRIAVSLKHSAAIRLLRTGAGQCRGTLTLRYRQKTTGKHFKLRTIGSARFAISPGKSQVVKVTLNKLGRKLFRAGHGKLNASVAVLRTTPAPTLAKTASVRLSVQKPSKRTAVKK